MGQVKLTRFKYMIGVLSIELNLGAPYLKIGTYNESIIEIVQADQINIYKNTWGLYEI